MAEIDSKGTYPLSDHLVRINPSTVRQELTNPKIPIALILIAALGSMCLTLGAGVFLYRNTRNLVASQQWVEHTQKVLLSLQETSQLVQRIEGDVNLYAATRNPDNLRTAEARVIRLQVLILRLENLVADNTQQQPHVQQLTECVSGLSLDLKASPAADLVNPQALRCQQSLSLMAEQESQLLKERSSASEERSKESVIAEASVVVISLMVLVALFGFLLRDVLIRTRIAREWERTNLKLEESNRNFQQSVQALQGHTREAALLGAFRDELQLCAVVQQVYHSAATRLPHLLPGTSGALCIINSSRHTVETVSSWGNASTLLSEVFSPDSCCGLRAGHLRWRGPEHSEIDCSHFIGTPPSRYVCAPLVAQGEMMGILFLECPSDECMRELETHSEALRQSVQLIASHASLELRRRLENQSIRDSLTGLFNRHFMQIALDRELARCTRHKGSLAVLMIDVDHFKTFNDRFSHAAGDTVLKEVARAFRENVRNEDVVCRYGGEEFTIILPDITAHAATEKADKIRKAVEKLQTSLDNSLYAEITISIGVAVFPEHGMTSDSLLRQADAALYRAKREGRNRVCVAGSGILQLVEV